jgi:hypothetical protein
MAVCSLLSVAGRDESLLDAVRLSISPIASLIMHALHKLHRQGSNYFATDTVKLLLDDVSFEDADDLDGVRRRHVRNLHCFS